LLGTVSAVLLLIKGIARALGLLRPPLLSEQPRPFSNDELDRWKNGLSPAETATAASQVASCWEPHMPATLRRQPSKHAWVEPSPSFARVVFAGGDQTPISCLMATRPEPADVEIIVPAFFIPANSPKTLEFAHAAFRGAADSSGRCRHVVVIDPRESPGWTNWFSPGARITGGWLEGLDVAMIVAQLRSQLGRRLRHVIVRGEASGATVALWSVHHALRRRIVIDRVHAHSPFMHLGSIISHLYPTRPRACVDILDPAFESRAFFRLMFDVGLSRYLDYGFGPGDPLRFLAAAGLPDADLRSTPPLRAASNCDLETPRGDLRAALPELGEAARRGILRIYHSRATPLIPRAEVEQLVNSINEFALAGNVETTVADKAGYRLDFQPDDSGSSFAVDTARLPVRLEPEPNSWMSRGDVHKAAS
jgi:hypothetical protein